MTPPDKIILTIIRGAERVFEKEGLFDIWVFPKEDGAVAAIHDAFTDEVLFEEIPIGSMSVSAPFVYIQTEKV
ncbi:hypothetical protein [Siphovirus Jomon_CT89]|nr:hypothetical protein [Siphovirus Jomon_CT89]